MSIRRGNTGKGPCWIVQIAYGPRGAYKRKARYVYGTKHDAERVEAELRIELSSKPPPPSPSPTFGDLFESYLAYVKTALRSWYNVTVNIKPLLTHFGANTPADSISHNDVIFYIAKRRKMKNKMGRFYAPSTIDRELAYLKSIYNFAAKNRLLEPPYNPAEHVNLANIPNYRDKVVDGDDFKKILSILTNKTHRGIWMFARFTGLRKASVLDLDWSQLKNLEIIAPPPFDNNGLFKGSKRFGRPPLPQGLIEILSDKAPDKGPLFTRNGKAITAASLRRTVTRTQKDEECAVDYWFHDLRRTYGTWLRKLGVDSDTRMAIMGHAPDNGYSTHYRYQVVSDADIIEVGKLIEADPFYQECIQLCSQSPVPGM